MQKNHLLTYFLAGVWLAAVSVVPAFGEQQATSTPTNSSGIRIQPITQLAWLEAYEAHLFHANTLWVGRNTDLVHDKYFRLEAYNSEGSRQLASIALTHTAAFIYPFGADQVLVVGKSYQRGGIGWQTGYTLVGVSPNGVVSLKRHVQLPTSVMVDQFAGNQAQMYFTEPGSRSIYEWRNNRFVAVASDISNPGKSLLVGNKLYSLERNEVNPGDENMVRIDLQTRTVDRLLTNLAFNNLSNVIYLNGYHKIAGSLSWAGAVVLIDLATWSKDGVEELSVGEGPYGLAQLGHCLCVLSLAPKTSLTFIDLNSSPKQIVGTWDLSGLGADFANPRHLAVDAATGRFYVRSNYASDVTEAEHHGVAMVEETNQQMFKNCTR